MESFILDLLQVHTFQFRPSQKHLMTEMAGTKCEMRREVETKSYLTELTELATDARDLAPLQGLA